MKILIVGFAKVKYMPYLKLYTDNIDIDKNDVHIMYWNRDLKDENVGKLKGIRLHVFKKYQLDDVCKLKKIGNFLKFRKEEIKLLKKEKFDFVIVLHSFPGVLIAGFLKKHYAGRFIFDYRDMTFEKFIFFRNRIHMLVNNSYATFVSSNGYRKIIPKKSNVYTTHNINIDVLKKGNNKPDYEGSNKIRMAFWGFIRHEKINREIIRKFAKDSRFELHYYGREQQIAINLRKYAKSISAGNIFFHGEYVPEDIISFAGKTDLIHNIYKDDNMMLAMSNKYYDGLLYNIPLVCMNGSFMSEMAEKAGIGRGFDPYDDDFTDSLYDYYINIDKKKFGFNVQSELKRVLEEYKDSEKIIGERLNKDE